MEYDKLSDRQIDALVAQKFFGWSKKEVRFDVFQGLELGEKTHQQFSAPILLGPNNEMTTAIPSYSTDIAAAWSVVEKLRETHNVSLMNIGGGPWDVGLVPRPVAGTYYTVNRYGSGHISAPRAICLAALLTQTES